MKQLPVIILMLFLPFLVHSQDTALLRLLKYKRFTELDQILKQRKLTDTDRSFYQAMLYNVFGKPLESNRLIEKILHNRKHLADSLRFMLLDTRYDNFVKLFEYENAYKSKKYLIENFVRYVKPDKLEDELRTMNIWKALKNEPRQTIRQQGNVTLPIKRDYLGLQTLPVTANGKEYDFVFDTGAGFSTATESFAEKINLHLIKDAVIVIKAGVTGTGTLVKLATADSLTIGSIIVFNPVFLVFPDSAMLFRLPDSSYLLNAVLGFPVIKELGKLTVYKDKINIGKSADTTLYKPNLAVALLKPLLFLGFKGQELPFTFDSGASGTTLSEVFYNEYKSWIDLVSTDKTVSMGGAGGLRKMKMKVLPEISFECSGKTVSLKNADVSTEVVKTADGVYYGNIGQDLIRQFKSMTIDFKNSWVKFND